jgi:uncharacterized protein YcbX
MSLGTISELWRYPVKSMQGERVDDAELTELGVVGDRTWALVDKEGGQVVSAKHPRKWGQMLQWHARLVDPQTAELTAPDGTVVRTDDPEVDAFLSAAVGRDVTLASTAPQDRRFEAVYPDIGGVLPDDFLAENKTGDEPDGTLTELALGLAAPPGTFFDLTVLHVITNAAVRAVGADVRRFRPNVVVDVDGEGYVENDWVGATLGLGSAARATVALPTMRCVMTTLPQPELPQDRGVLQTVARDNRVEIPGLGVWACAGIYCSVDAPGRVGLGDEVTRI